MTELRTERLTLRRWRDADREPFAALNADPEVMRHFPATLSREQSDAMIDRIDGDLARQGFGLWAVDAPDGFIGFVGLARPRFEAHFTPATEVGWRLARHAWGHGYATEAARAVLAHAFTALALPGLVSFTAHTNARSRAVMRRLGLTHDPAEDFRHPNIPPDDPLQPCVLYRIDAAAWRAENGWPEAGGPQP
ncbi:GNAT family N-acetyltransferase [Catenuloplanes indicus]|uniref:Ribosomal-protein-alanine N-acetyltransferase n=1 Tax=Catenuloplanes indicus TaxID=137267 RepID=A0AAE3W6P1_9ACTN|nr:GNAT family N-acetyltransferase [Catenuloplanes indicus]MDQ0370310.1 ribosomal-protein-alanine N-acetyltransferase [Catenuloplanes indicus]